MMIQKIHQKFIFLVAVCMSFALGATEQGNNTNEKVINGATYRWKDELGRQAVELLNKWNDESAQEAVEVSNNSSNTFNEELTRFMESEAYKNSNGNFIVEKVVKEKRQFKPQNIYSVATISLQGLVQLMIDFKKNPLDVQTVPQCNPNPTINIEGYIEINNYRYATIYPSKCTKSLVDFAKENGIHGYAHHLLNS